MTAESNQALFLAASRDEFRLLVRPISIIGFSLVRKMRRSGKAKEEEGLRLLRVTSTGEPLALPGRWTRTDADQLTLIAILGHSHVEADIGRRDRV